MIALWRMPMILVTTLEQSFLPGGRPEGEAPPDRAALERWRQRYFAATRRIRQAGIQTIADDQAGVEIYVALRARWDSDIARLAPLMAYRMEDIDPAGSEPDASDRRKDFRARLHSPR
jgi:hypothetical protein